jgi:site-specific recombinase XerC
MIEYLELRRSLGFKLIDLGRELEKFVCFLEQMASPVLTVDLAVSWAKQDLEADPVQWANRLSVTRRFAQYLKAFDPCTEVPPLGLLGPSRYRRKAPHIYSHRETTSLMEAARQLRVLNGVGLENSSAMTWTSRTPC